MRQQLPWIAAVIGGMTAAMHLWKVPPFVPLLRDEFGASLTDAGLLIGIMQLAGVIGGLFFGILIESLGVRRAMVIGLVALTAASVAGAFVGDFGWLLAMRALESFGYMLTIVSAPALVRRVASPERLTTAMGWWATYMGVSSGLTLAAAALFAGTISRQMWWLGTSAVSALAVVFILLVVPADPKAAERRRPREVLASLGRTITVPAPWFVALTFMSYSLSWVAVIGFLPTVYDAVGIGARTAGLLTALASAVNMIGAFSGALLMRTKLGPRGVVWIGAAAMGIGSWLVFGSGAPFIVTYLAVLAFSALGGLIPSVLTRLAVDSAPPGGSVPVALGLVQQLTNIGQFIGPVLVGILVDVRGNWGSTWWVNVAGAVLGSMLIVFATSQRFGVRWQQPDAPGASVTHAAPSK
ncbi:MFS transporter [Gulosibacter macacae]|nr:MFS transporter [Gulosibacter macacae]